MRFYCAACFALKYLQVVVGVGSYPFYWAKVHVHSFIMSVCGVDGIAEVGQKLCTLPEKAFLYVGVSHTCSMKCDDQRLSSGSFFLIFRTMDAQVRKCTATNLSVTNFTPPFMEFSPGLSKKTPMGWRRFMPRNWERLYIWSAARRQQCSGFSESRAKSISCLFSLFFFERNLTRIFWISWSRMCCARYCSVKRISFKPRNVKSSLVTA